MRKLWKRLRRSLVDDLGQFAGGSAVSDPLGLLAVEQEHLTAQRDADPGMSGPGSGPPARIPSDATYRSPG
jgi:hypothetical protein